MKMDSYHFGKKSILIQIEDVDFNLFIIGEYPNNKTRNINVNVNFPAALNVEDIYNSGAIIKTITNSGELSLNLGKTMLPCFFEDGQYQIVLEKKNECNYDIVFAGQKVTDSMQIIGDNYIGIINFSSNIGYTDIDIYKETKKIFRTTIEVFPSKLDYHKDYRELIMEINEEVASLAFKLLDKTYLRGKLTDTEHQTNTDFINILDIVFEGLEKALKRITHNFKHSVITQEGLTNIHKAKRISSKSRAYLRTHADTLVLSKQGFINFDSNSYLPEKVVEVRKITSIDIYENRFVKYMVQKIIKRLKSVEAYLDNKNEGERGTLYFIRQKTSILEKYLNNHFRSVSDLTGNKSMSLVFQMASGYKEMYKKYVILNKGLDLGDDLFKITPKKLYSLYEMWCYIKIHKILEKLGYVIEEYGILQYKDNGMYLSLLQDYQAKMVYRGPKNKLELWYNKSYSLPTTNQRPDTVLQIRNLSGNDNRTYIFDAKYRVAIDNNGAIGPEVEDINVMHRYRDSIVSEMSNNFQYKYETFGAYVMFPYGDEEAFKNHKFYKSIEKVNIGAFPMLPGSTKLLTQHLERLVSQSDLEAKNERMLIDEYDDFAKFKLENVMVVNVKDGLHLKQYLENNFYHIPAKRLSNIRLGVEYLAFYQSIRAFGENGGIRYFAKIKDISRYKRNECLEIPPRKGTEEETYLRFTLGDIETVDHIDPIQSGTQIVSYTTLYLLKNAANMHELKLNSNLEVELYKRLKQIARENNWVIRKEHNKYLINKNSIEILEDKKIRINGRISNLNNLEKELIY